MYSHILVPLDGSATSDRGLAEAIALARTQNGALRLLHVIDDYPIRNSVTAGITLPDAIDHLRKHGEALLAKGRETASKADIKAETVQREVTHGRVADLIIEEAEKGGCDLIVMGTHGRRGFSRMALGSEAEQVIRHSQLPLLLVRHEEADK